MKILTLRVKILAAAVPYAAVLLGMYVFENAWAAILSYHMGTLLFLSYLRPEGLFKRLRTGYFLPIILPAIVICGAAAPVMYFLWPMLVRPDVILSGWLAGFGLEGIVFILLIPYFGVIHPILEEAHWRTLTQFEPFKVLCWQDVAFAGYHMLVLSGLMRLPWLVMVFGILVSASVFWRWTGRRFGGYGVSFITHAIADASIIIGAFWISSGQ